MRYHEIIAQEYVTEDSENFNGIELSLEIQKDDEYVDDDDYDNQVLYVTASSNGRELGHVLFAFDGEYLLPQDLEVEERFRGQGIAQTMYDYVKSKGYKIRRSGQQTDAGAGFWAKHRPEQNVWEAFDQPYSIKWEEGDNIEAVDALATLGDGTYLSIMFNKEFGDYGDDLGDWAIEFHRNNSQEVSGEGDAQRVFATVLEAIRQFVKKYKPNTVTFSASKEPEPDMVRSGANANPESRAKLYNRLVDRYAGAMGYSAQQHEGNGKVTYTLRQSRQGVAEGTEQNYLSQIPGLTWQPVSRSVWNTIQDEGLDEEQAAPEHTDWVMASLSISPKDAQALQAFDDDAIEDFNRFDIHLKSRYPGLTDLIDYDKGTVTIVKTAKEQGVTESLRVDVPNEEWLQNAIDYAKQKSPDRHGLPYMGKTTATVRSVDVPVDILKRIPGMRREQQNVRQADLAAIVKIMSDTGKLPLGGHTGEEYKPFINVAYDGSAWVNEGNHRIMAAAKLGWETLPVEISYFDGGERVESGAMYPGKIGLGQVSENFADGKVKGKSRPGRVKRAGASCDGSVSSLRARAKQSGGEKGKMYHWCANMKSGRKK